MRRTLDEIRRDGLEALRDRLGRAGLVRFLEQFETGRGDYAKQRRGWAKGTTLSDIRANAAERRKRKPSRRGRNAA